MPDEVNDVGSISYDRHIQAMAAERLRLLESEIKRLEQKIDDNELLAQERDVRYNERFTERDKRYTERFEAQQAALLYQRETTNEFRGQLRDQASTFIPRTEALTHTGSNAEKIDTLAARIDRNEGRAGGFQQGWLFLIGAVSLAGALIAIFFALKG